MIDLSIIIVNYNVKEFLLNLLKSILKASSQLKVEIIIVDNASEDGSPRVIKEKFPEIKLIENNINVGFGKANNQALKIAKGKFILLINPDAIVREDTLVKMVQFFREHSACGLAGCKVLNPDGTLQLACRRSFPTPWVSFSKIVGLSKLFPKSKLFAKYNLTFLDENKTYEVDAVSGSFMMLRRETYSKIGGFDERFFMYGEDLDYCYRVKQAGYKVYYFAGAEVIHYKGESTRRSPIDETNLFYDAMNLFVEKHFSSSFIVKLILRFAIFIRRLFAFLNLFKLPIFSVLLDYILFVISLFLAEHLYKKPSWQGFPLIVKPYIYLLPALFQSLVSSFTGVYKKSLISVGRNLLALFTGFIFLSALTFFFKQYAYSRAVIIITYALAVTFFSIWRIVLKLFFKIGLSSEGSMGKTVVVGVSPMAIDLARKLKSNFTDIYYVIGLIGKSLADVGKTIEGFKVIGSLSNINKIIKENDVKRIIFSSEEISFEEIFYVVSSSQNQNVSFLLSGSNLDYIVGKSSVTLLNDIPLLKIDYNISRTIHKLQKRLFDIALSVTILLLLYPFIYLFSRVSSKNKVLIDFVLNVPSVLRGKLSFVGPRKSGYHDKLFLGKKGLTGLWFTEIYDRNDPEEENKLNIFYAKNQSIWLDLEILGKTISKIFFGRGI